MDSWCPWDHIWAILSLAVELTGHSEDLNKARDEKFELGGTVPDRPEYGPSRASDYIKFYGATS
jgi:hypothetical protein